KFIMSKHEVTVKSLQLKLTEQMDNAFVQSMITQQDNGNRINGTFTTQAYINMVEELSTKLGMDFTKKPFEELSKPDAATLKTKKI
ncbi:hypothetical protein M8C21_023733, partial [Ambrosia artemisiifolia]